MPVCPVTNHRVPAKPARFFRRSVFCSTLGAVSLLVGVWAGLSPAALRAEETRQAGHSMQGVAFNEGPRQAARLMGHTGSVHLPVSTHLPEAQAFFNQGLGQLHGFWYYEAERSFRQVLSVDSDVAMAYWGLAMANHNNAERAKPFIAEGHRRRNQASPHEQKYLQALYDFHHPQGEKSKKERWEKYLRDLDRLVTDDPHDLEARALLAVSLWQARDADVPIVSYWAVNSLLDPVFAKQPMHPAHHFRIHLWDKEHSALALESAAACGQSAPDIAHMWHMSGHIYSDLNRWVDAVWQQEAAVRVDHAYMIRDVILPDQIHNFAHNTEWLIRNLDHLGRSGDAVQLALNLIEMPRHPKFFGGDAKGTAGYGQQRLWEMLERYELWSLMRQYGRPPYHDVPQSRSERLAWHRAQGIAALRMGETSVGLEHADVVRQLRLEVQQEVQRLQWELEPEQHPVSALRTEHLPAEPADALLPSNHNDGTVEQRKALLKKREAELETATVAFQELVALQAIGRGDATAALRALQTVDAVRLDGRWLAEVQLQAGETAAAIKRLRKSADSKSQQVRPRAALVEGLWKSGDRDAARREFTALRTLAGHADLTAPPFQRLSDIAEQLGWPRDWRDPAPPATDVGVRPSLDSLGPLLWAPPKAPSWSAKDSTGLVRDASEFAGRPTVYLFFLGGGCLHCAEQLQAFARRIDDWTKQGISVVGISTDDVPKLSQQLLQNASEPFPFVLLSDERLDAFRRFRCYDDFEQQPLHGTFLVDAEGRLRWWDIRHEPFMDVPFLLNEATRLLQIRHDESISIRSETAAALFPAE
jgi:peroxiredoxin